MWKETTDDHRHVFRGLLEDSANKRSYVSELHEIENNLLVHRIEPRQELLEIARDAGWDVQSLKNWTSVLTMEEQGVEVAAQGEEREDSKDNSKDNNSGDSDGNGDGDSEHSLAETHLEDAYFASSYSSVTEVGITLVCFLVVTGLLLMGFIQYSNGGYINNGKNVHALKLFPFFVLGLFQSLQNRLNLPSSLSFIIPPLPWSRPLFFKNMNWDQQNQYITDILCE